MSKCALCACVLLYSRDPCTVALGLCCFADSCARSHRVYWAHCTVCAALHYQYFVCGAALLGAVHCTALYCVCRAALHLWAAGNGSVAMHCHSACGQWAVELLQLSAALPLGSGQLGVQLLQCTATLPGAGDLAPV